MANCLRIPMAPSLRSSSSSSLRPPRRRTFAPINSSKLPFPPPNDPLLKRLADAAAVSPDGPKDDMLEDMGLLGSPKLRATMAAARYSGSRRARNMQPPDLPSLLLHGRIVYIGMPLVSAVTELIVCELLHLQFDNPTEPIYLYINSTGTTRDDGETVALETEGLAIYDVLSLMECPIYTLCTGVAVGWACLLLAAGTKGKRFMMPSTRASFQEPRVPPSGILQASDLEIRANEAKAVRDIFVKLLAKHTGNSLETVAKAIDIPFHMEAKKAIEFGVADKIFYGEKKEVLISDATKRKDLGRGF